MWPFKRKPASSARTIVTGRSGTWQVAQGKLGDDVLFTRFDRKYDELLGETRYALMLGVAVELPHLPTREEGKVLNEIEDRLRELLEHGSQSVLVGVLTTPKLRQYIFYTAETDRALELVAELKPKLPGRSITARAESDPDWQFYRTFALNAEAG
jgi:uncharacterized protein DUF695